MNPSSLRDLGVDLLEERQFDRALAFFAEAVHRRPADHQSRTLAATCLAGLGEKERAVIALHACAEGLLRRGYLLSAIAACKRALELNTNEKRVQETLLRIHARAIRAAPGKAAIPPPLPPEVLYDGKVSEDLVSMRGQALSDKAIEVLAAPDLGELTEQESGRALPLFADLDPEPFVELVGAMGYRTCKPGEAIAVQGQSGESIFVIISGQAQVARQSDARERILAYLKGGSILGELSLLTGAPPSATVSARTETEVFEIHRDHLNSIAKRFPSVTRSLVEFAQRRMARNLIATSPLLQQIDDSNRAALLNRFCFRALQPHETALVEGQHSPGMFLVLAGELMVQKEDPAGGVVSLGILREGDVAGEISLLTGLRATATVVATRKTAAAYIERGAFEELIRDYPQMKGYLEALSERRLKQIGEALRPAEIIDADELLVDAENHDDQKPA
jgi:CRP-like cAMP-binding protein